MNEELKAALDKYKWICVKRGYGGPESKVPSFAEMLDAEAAVVAIFEAEQRKVKSLLKLAQEQAEAAVANKALFEAREKNRKQLAEALREEAETRMCNNCTAPVAAYLDRHQGCDQGCLRMSGATRAALAAYEALEAKG
jgi:hypothetical protein